MMIRLPGLLLRPALAALQIRRELALVNLALRQQISVLQATRRPSLTNLDRVFWAILRRRMEHFRSHPPLHRRSSFMGKSWNSKSEFKKLSGQLAVAEEKDFEARALRAVLRSLEQAGQPELLLLPPLFLTVAALTAAWLPVRRASRIERKSSP